MEEDEGWPVCADPRSVPGRSRSERCRLVALGAGGGDTGARVWARETGGDSGGLVTMLWVRVGCGAGSGLARSGAGSCLLYLGSSGGVGGWVPLSISLSIASVYGMLE